MKKIFRLGFLAAALLFSISCSKEKRETEANSPSVENNISIIIDSVYVSQYGGYGYDIMIDGEVRVHQPHIPVVAGTIGFASIADARKAARLVVSKIKLNQFPPLLTLQELKDLKVVQ